MVGSSCNWMGATVPPVASNTAQATTPHPAARVAQPNEKKLASFSCRRNNRPARLPATYPSRVSVNKVVGEKSITTVQAADLVV